MKYIITEQQNRLRRRLEEIKNRVELCLIDIYEEPESNLPLSLQMLILIVSDMVSSSIAHEINLRGDEFITFRNQTKQYIRNNFYSRIKEFWESKQNKSLTTESKTILETFSPQLRRRISFDTLKSELDNVFDYEINICLYPNVGELISEVADLLSVNIFDSLFNETNFTPTPKEKDTLYYYLVDMFSKYISKKYKEECSN